MSEAAIYPSLEGEAVFITGGATGLGASLVEAFASQGASVGFVDLNSDAGTRLSSAVEETTGKRPWFTTTDVTDVPALERAINDAIDELGPMFALINNVGNDARMPPQEVTEKDWRQCMAVNLDAAFFAARAVFHTMRERGHGSIINVSSINAILGFPDMPGYMTAKAGLLGMTKALACDYGESGVRVNAILPGWVLTDRQLDSWLTPEAEEEWMKHVALKRRLMPADVAKLALFLAADDSAMITGQSFTIDGGRT